MPDRTRAGRRNRDRNRTWITLTIFLLLLSLSARAQQPAATPNLAQQGIVPPPPAAVTPQMAATPPPAAVPPVQAVLHAIRLSRSVVFESDPTSKSQAVMARTVEQPHSGSTMDVEFRISATSPQWDIVSVTPVKPRIVDMGGKPLGLLGVTPSREDTGSDRYVRVSCALPSREHPHLAEVTSAFKVSLGKKQAMRVSNARQFVGRDLLDTRQFPDVQIKLMGMDQGSLALTATGRADRVGSVRLTNVDGEEFEPLLEEVTDKNASDKTKNQKLWRIGYSKLPTIVNLYFDIYDDVRTVTLQVSKSKVPLP